MGVGGISKLCQTVGRCERSLWNDMRIDSAGEKEKVILVFGDFRDSLPIVQNLKVGESPEDSLGPNPRRSLSQGALLHPLHPPPLRPVNQAGANHRQKRTQPNGQSGRHLAQQKECDVSCTE
jgi:hypothetical protein